MRTTRVALVGLLLASALALAATPEEGKPAPAFEVEATSIGTALPDKKDAKTIALKDFEGKKNVVLFLTFTP